MMPNNVMLMKTAGSPSGQRTTSPQFDTSVAHPARVYAYWIGGKDHYEADRRAATEVIRVRPQVVAALGPGFVTILVTGTGRLAHLSVISRDIRPLDAYTSKAGGIVAVLVPRPETFAASRPTLFGR